MKEQVPRILVVDDDRPSLEALAALVRREGFDVATAEDLESAAAIATSDRFAVVLIDYNLPDGKGLELVERLADPRPEVVLITGQATFETAVEALRAGASDFLVKPVDATRLKTLLESVSRTNAFRSELHELRDELRELGRFGPMIGASAAMQEVYDRIARVAPTDASVLVTGESGTGKELVAETVHRLSRRSHRALVAVNCGAISANLIESELFGHERGAFTGAERQRKGLFERAHQGTLFLDEISEMPIELQVKLLRVLETGKFMRVGGDRPIDADVRIVAASNRDLEASVAAGHFRADLLYRLRVLPIALPALRERGDDLESLVRHFLGEIARREETPAKRISDRALEALLAYPFPGNVRELRNAVQQAWILADQTIEVEHLPEGMRAGARPLLAPTGGERVVLDLPTSLADAERALILATLDQLGGDKNEVAKTLGISVKTLYTRLREYRGRDDDAAAK